jgi:hypothetical protein
MTVLADLMEIQLEIFFFFFFFAVFQLGELLWLNVFVTNCIWKLYTLFSVCVPKQEFESASTLFCHLNQSLVDHFQRQKNKFFLDKGIIYLYHFKEYPSQYHKLHVIILMWHFQGTYFLIIRMKEKSLKIQRRGPIFFFLCLSKLLVWQTEGLN